jgi:hypothetical protein
MNKPTDPRETDPQLENIDPSNIEGSLIAITEGLAGGSLTVDQAKSLTSVLATLHSVRDNASLASRLEQLRELIESRKRV